MGTEEKIGGRGGEVRGREGGRREGGREKEREGEWRREYGTHPR